MIRKKPLPPDYVPDGLATLLPLLGDITLLNFKGPGAQYDVADYLHTWACAALYCRDEDIADPATLHLMAVAPRVTPGCREQIVRCQGCRRGTASGSVLERLDHSPPGASIAGRTTCYDQRMRPLSARLRASIVAAAVLLPYAPALADVITPEIILRRPGAERSPPDPATAEPRVLIGVLSRQLTGGCENGKDVWREPAHFEIGFVRAQLPPQLGADALVGKIVVARGHTADARPVSHARFDTSGLCSVMQMRDDWIVSQNGIRVFTPRTGALARLGAFAVDSVQAAEVISFPPGPKTPATTIPVRVHNPLDQPLTALRLIGHYEGCFGKPGTSTETRDLGALPKGGATQATLPAQLMLKDQPRRANYRLASVRLTTDTPGVALDLDVPVQKNDCPRP